MAGVFLKIYTPIIFVYIGTNLFLTFSLTVELQERKIPGGKISS